MLAIRSIIKSATLLVTNFILFLHRMLHCNNSIVNQCIMHASHDANTLIGYKLSFFRSKFGYNLYDLSLSQCLRYSSRCIKLQRKDLK